MVRGICSVHRFNRHLALVSPSYAVSPQKITEHMWKQELAMNLCQPVTSCQSIIYSEICWAKSGPQSRVQTQDSRGIKTCDKRSRAVMHLALKQILSKGILEIYFPSLCTIKSMQRRLSLHFRFAWQLCWQDKTWWSFILSQSLPSLPLELYKKAMVSRQGSEAEWLFVLLSAQVLMRREVNGKPAVKQPILF